MRKGFKKAKAKHGRNKTWIREFGLSFLRDQTVERERGRGKERRRGRGREEEEKKKRKRKKMEEQKRYGTTKFEYGSLVCMIIILPKPRVLLGFHPNPIIMESKVDKTLNSTRSI